MRFADDFVCAFQNRSDAESFFEELGERLGTFGLEVALDKTRIVRFCRFDFLGFEFYWERTRSGRPGVKRRTSRKKLRASLATITDWIRRNRHRRAGQLFSILGAKYRGYWNYYGVIGNYAGLSQFFYRSKRIVFTRLNRRSQRTSYTRAGFQDALDFFGVEGPRITEQRGPVQLRLL